MNMASSAEPGCAFPDHLRESDLHVWRAERFQSAELLHVFRLLADERVDHVVDGNDTEHASLIVDHGHGEQIVFGNHPRHLFAVSARRHRDRRAAVAYVANSRQRRSEHQLPQRDHALQALIVVEHVDRVDRLLGAGDIADVSERLFDRPIRGHGQHLGGHDAARRLGRIAQQHRQRGARRRIEMLEQPVAGRHLELAEEIRLLVGRHRLDQRDGGVRLHAFDDLVAPVELRFVEHLYREIEWQRGHHFRRPGRRQIVQRFGDVCRAHASQRFSELRGVAVEQVEQLGCGGRHDGSRVTRTIATDAPRGASGS
jgi:hypothetical protein